MPYYPLNQKRAEESQKELQQGVTWTPKEGNNYVRVMPPWNEKGEIYTKVFFHWRVGPDEQSFPCLKQFGQECPICTACEVLAKSNSSMARELSARPRYMLNIIDLENVNFGVQVWGCGKTVLQEVLGYINDPKWGDLTHPDKGRNIVIHRIGTGRDTEFQIRPDPEVSPLADMAWLDNLHNLDVLVSIPDVAVMMKAVEGAITRAAIAIPSSRSAPAPAVLPPPAARPTPPSNPNPPAPTPPGGVDEVKNRLNAAISRMKEGGAAK
jgi:hypothetical protein